MSTRGLDECGSIAGIVSATYVRAFDGIVGGWRPNVHREILAERAKPAPRFSTVDDVQ